VLISKHNAAKIKTYAEKCTDSNHHKEDTHHSKEDIPHNHIPLKEEAELHPNNNNRG